MRRHAKASSAGSTMRQANGLGAIFRGAFATRGASGDFSGSGAPSGRGLRQTVGVSALTLVFVLLFAPQALAASAPSVDDTYATEVITKEGRLHAEINPNEAETTYQFQYVDGAHYQPLAVNPYEEGEVAPASAQSIGAGAEDVKVSREIEGLTPGTLYHYRVVATNAEGTTKGPDRAIRTFRPFSADSECANQGLRYGAATALSDCRAYEMVSPVDKGQGDIKVLRGADRGIPQNMIQSTPEGERLAYNSYRAFGDAQSNPSSSQYIAQRTAEGWQTHSINPPRTEPFGIAAAQFDNEYKGFSEDLCHGWIVPYGEPQLAPGGQLGFANLYRRNDGLCGPTGFETVVPLPSPPSSGPNLQFQGASADGSHALFMSQAKLAPEGTEGKSQLYLSTSPGATPEFVCVLPNGTPWTGHCQAGSGRPHFLREAVFTGAISDDGSRIFWDDDSGDSSSGIGKLYVRLDGTQTLAVSKVGEEETGAANDSFFWGITPDGSRAVYTAGDGLFAFELEDEATEPIAEGVLGVVGVSEDARRIYFVSSKDLAGSAVEGEPNLYLYDAGNETYTFIATVESSDTLLDSPQMYFHQARVSPNGMRMAFTSSASLTGYDNRDVAPGLVFGTRQEEVFVYNAESEALACASCDPSGARDEQARGFMPGAESNTYFTRVLSEDGSRLFFTSSAALIPRDTNGKADVYEWEEAGAGSCDESDPSYAPNNDGCIYLISSGTSPLNSEFVDASANGDDVFINTLSSFLPQDDGLSDIYDARVEGGFPIPTKVTACEGEACQNAPEAPNDPTPGSSSYNGPGNVSETPAVAKKHKKKHHKRRHAHKRHRANHNRRASR